MSKPLLALTFAATLGLGACSGMGATEQRMLSGGAAGAAGGAAIGAVTGGSAITGALVGGAVGTAGGFLWDRYQRDRGQ